MVREDPRVIRVPNLPREQGGRLRHDRLVAQHLLHRVHLGRGGLDPLGEHAPLLDEVDLTGEDLVLGELQTHLVSTEAAGRERADEHVRVEEDPHQTSEKTSSSVRIP